LKQFIMSLHDRPYRSEADYNHMRRLLIDALALTGLPVYATIGDIDWWRAADEDEGGVKMAHLWFDGERPAAWAWPVDDQVDIVVHPAYPALHDAALAWAEDEYRQRQGELPEKPMRAWSYTGDATRHAALAARGYRRTEDGFVFFTRPIVLAGPPPLPPGYAFDHVRGEADVARRTAVQRAAFESEFMTEVKTRAVQASPTYRPELDLVIVAPDGEYAAFAQIWLDEANRVGVFEPVGVAAAHRRRGLGRALMHEGARRLGELGARVACVGTGFDNAPARAMYEAAGFTELDRNYAWIRP
jgi:predicted N-acetyltransferase YhbS